MPPLSCRGGCGAAARNLVAINEDLVAAPAVAMNQARVAVKHRTIDLDSTYRTLLSARLTRFQLELAGYCPTCALRGQIKAQETGLWRTGHG
jgi:hypothetical protein